MVEGNALLQNSPAQNGRRQQVTPSVVSGMADQTPARPLVELGLVRSLVLFRCPPRGMGRSRRSCGRCGENGWPSRRDSRQVLNFEMPDTGIPDFAQHAKAIARAGAYDLGVHRDAILRPVVLGYWNVAGSQGLTPSAEAARTRFWLYIARLGRASARGKSRRVPFGSG